MDRQEQSKERRRNLGFADFAPFSPLQTPMFSSLRDLRDLLGLRIAESSVIPQGVPDPRGRPPLSGNHS